MGKEFDDIAARLSGKRPDTPVSAEMPPVSTFTVRHWLDRELEPPDFLLANLFSTTTRALLIGSTGTGKTNFGMALAFAMSKGTDFLHWRTPRAAKHLLYVDGEMSSRLLRERLIQAVDRHGHIPDNLTVLNRDDFPQMPPLNTPDGQQFMDRAIADLGAEFVIFDNIQSLLVGSMADEEAWSQVLPWTRDLTRRAVGQLWQHHTGIDTSRGYGTKTREWQLDTVMLMKARAEDAQLIDFDLEFTKARERTPTNRADFVKAHIWLGEDNRWFSSIEPAAKPAKAVRLSEKDRAALDCLHDVLARDGRQETGKHVPAGALVVTLDAFRDVLKQRGLYDGKIPKSRQWFYDAKSKLVAAGKIGIDGELVWAIAKS